MNNLEILPLDITSAANGINKNLKQDEKDLKKACGEFEAYFVASMLKEMRRSVPVSYTHLTLPTILRV